MTYNTKRKQTVPHNKKVLTLRSDLFYVRESSGETFPRFRTHGRKSRNHPSPVSEPLPSWGRGVIPRSWCPFYFKWCSAKRNIQTTPSNSVIFQPFSSWYCCFLSNSCKTLFHTSVCLGCLTPWDHAPTPPPTAGQCASVVQATNPF